MQKTQVRSLGWEDPLENEMASPSNILPGELHGQRSLVGYSAWGCKELKMTERLSRAQKDVTSGCRHDPRWIWLEEKMSMGGPFSLLI